MPGVIGYLTIAFFTFVIVSLTYPDNNRSEAFVVALMWPLFAVIYGTILVVFFLVIGVALMIIAFTGAVALIGLSAAAVWGLISYVLKGR